MKKLRLSLVLMIATILVLAVFEGYWLHKLYKDEYRDLRKEVDVSFRETMNTLRVNMFQQDSSLLRGFTSTAVVRVSPEKPNLIKASGTIGIQRVDNIPASVGNVPKGDIVATTVPMNLPKGSFSTSISNLESVNIVRGNPVAGMLVPGKQISVGDLSAINISPDSIERIAIKSGYSFKGAPNPALIELILKSQLGAKDTGRRVFIRMDTTVSFSTNGRKIERDWSVSLNMQDSAKTKEIKQLFAKAIQEENDSQKLLYLLSLLKNDSASHKQFSSLSIRPNSPLKLTKANVVKEPKDLNVTTRVIPKAVVKSQASPVINFLSSSKAVNDSIPMARVDSAYRSELQKINRNLPFKILFYSYRYQDSIAKMMIAANKDTLSDVSTDQFISGYTVPYSYQAVFNRITPYILDKMQMQIGGSVILLLLVMISFVVMYRNMLAQHRLSVMKNDFISNITHELKTPIATVGVAIEALRNFNAIQSPERTKEYLDISASELQRLSLLVDKVLKLSMFEKKKLELNKEPFDLKELLQETMNIMKLQFEKHKAAVSFNCPEGNYMIEADKLHITSVIYNLLDNALKYSPGKPNIQVRLEATSTHALQLDITDNGLGIAPQHQSRIFEKFFRVPTGNQHNIKGYGLGLSYVSEVVKSHQGTIHLTSEEGKGSTFSILLPSYSS